MEEACQAFSVTPALVVSAKKESSRSLKFKEVKNSLSKRGLILSPPVLMHLLSFAEPPTAMQQWAKSQMTSVEYLFPKPLIGICTYETEDEENALFIHLVKWIVKF